MRLLAELPLRRPVATLMLLLSLMVLGLVAVDRLPLDFIPAVKTRRVEVRVPYPGSHPDEVLREVVEPIEEEIATIPGIEALQSTAAPSYAQLEVRFADRAKLEVKRLAVREAVERARPRLPGGVGYVQVRGHIAGPGAGAILQGRIAAGSGEGGAALDLSQSWELLERRIKRPLERVKGVAYVDLYGVEPQQVRVELDLPALLAHGLHAGRVLAAIDAANLDLDLGAVSSDALRHEVRFEGRFRDLDALRRLRLAPGVVLADVARVSLRPPRLDYGRHLDRRFALGIDVHKEPTANTVETVDRLLERIAEVQQDPQLAGVKLLVWSNAGQEIRSSLGSLLNAGIWGGVLAVVVLLGFLRRLATTAVVAVAIPFSLLVACGAMYLLDSRFDVLTLLGLMLGVGMVVDNAVVVIENIHRLQSAGLEPFEAARRGVSGVFLAVLASTATTVIVWSWLFVSEPSGLTIYMGAVAQTICLTVVCSLLISVTFIPLAAARFVPARERPPGPILRRLIPAYRRLLGWTLRHRLVTVVALLALAGTAALPIHAIEKTGQPRMRERAVSIHYDVLGAQSKELLEGYVDQVEAWIAGQREELGYESIYSWFSETRGTLTLVYLPQDQISGARIAALRQRLRETLIQIPGVRLSVGERQWWRGGASGRRMVSLALHGDDPEQLERVARELEEQVRAVPGVIEAVGPERGGRQEVRVRVDPERAHALGMTPRSVATAVAFAFRGRYLSAFQGEGGESEMLLSLPEDSRPGLATLRSLPLPRDDGSTVPLDSLATLELAPTQRSIRRVDRETSLWVSAEFSDALTTEEAQERLRTALAGWRPPDGITWDFGAWGRERKEVLNTMLQGVGLSLLVVVLLLVALFESFTQPLAIVITLPLAFFGAFWALWLGGYELDAVAFIGVIILIGLVVNNGIVMVDHVNALRAAGQPRDAAILEGCGNRLRPVLMTAITTLVGLIPLVFAGSTVAGAYIDSLAVAVIGGLASSTLLTLVGLPVWYAAVTRDEPTGGGAPGREASGAPVPDGRSPARR